MNEDKNFLKKELAIYGFVLSDNNQVECASSNGSKTKYDINAAISGVSKQIESNKDLLLTIWHKAAEALSVQGESSPAVDEKTSNLFISSIKDLMRFALCFQEIKYSVLFKKIQTAADRDINTFSLSVIRDFPSIKISIDWMHRVIVRQLYVIKLFNAALEGDQDSENPSRKQTRKQTITASSSGVSGPWANLDLPYYERVFPWSGARGIDEEVRGRDRDIRNQQRYKKGLEHYNDDRFQEGHYFYDPNQMPYSWDKREIDSPYKGTGMMRP